MRSIGSSDMSTPLMKLADEVVEKRLTEATGSGGWAIGVWSRFGFDGEFGLFSRKSPVGPLMSYHV
jgi:hypothetical protein